MLDIGTLVLRTCGRVVYLEDSNGVIQVDIRRLVRPCVANHDIDRTAVAQAIADAMNARQAEPRKALIEQHPTGWRVVAGNDEWECGSLSKCIDLCKGKNIEILSTAFLPLKEGPKLGGKRPPKMPRPEPPPPFKPGDKTC